MAARKTVAPPLGRRPDPQEHGTRKGYGQHIRRGETPCPECKEAENEYQREQRRIRVEEGRQRQRNYNPRIPKVRVYLDPAVVDTFLRNGKDAAALKEIRAELRDALENTKGQYNHGDLLKDAKAARNGH